MGDPLLNGELLHLDYSSLKVYADEPSASRALAEHLLENSHVLKNHANVVAEKFGYFLWAVAEGAKTILSDFEFSTNEILRTLSASPSDLLRESKSLFEKRYSSLSRAKQEEWRRFSIFASAFDLEAARAVLGDACHQCASVARHSGTRRETFHRSSRR